MSWYSCRYHCENRRYLQTCGRRRNCTMPVKQSASREEFLKALGLNTNNPEDKLKLQQMWVSTSTDWTVKFPLIQHRKRSQDSGYETLRQLQERFSSPNMQLVLEFTSLTSGPTWIHPRSITPLHRSGLTEDIGLDSIMIAERQRIERSIIGY